MSTTAEQIQALKDKVGILEDEIVTLLAEIEILERPPAPPLLPLEVVLHHDTVPVPGRLNVHVARPLGKWSDPKTWSTGKVPGPADRVRVQHPLTVMIDGDAVCDVLVVDGALGVYPDAKASLTLSTFFGMPGAEFQCGWDADPMDGSFTCLFRPAPPDPADKLRYHGGLVWMGEFTVHGKKKAAHAELLDAAITAGDLHFEVRTTDLNWDHKDELLFPDTRQLKEKERAAGYNQVERIPIESYFGKDIATMARPFAFSHVPGKTDDGIGDVWPRVANLTRNVIFKAEVPGTAHVQFFDNARVDIRYASFQGMGRTTNAPLDATNLIGRYHVHLHKTHEEFVLEGVVVDGGDTVHIRKWGIVGHGAKGRITECVVYNTAGAGIMLEDGSEQIRIERNFVCRVTGIGGRVDSDAGGRGRQGTGIYLAGPFCDVEGNFVANVDAAGGKPYAYAYAMAYNRLGKVTIDGVLVDGNGGGGGIFRDNVAFACQSGMVPWWVGYGNPVPAEPKETLIDGFVSVNHWLYGIFMYPCQNVRFELKTRGDGTAIGIYAADYVANDIVFVPDIQGQRNGIIVSTMGGPQTIHGGKIRVKESAVVTTTPWTSSVDGGKIGPRDVVIDGTVLEAPVLVERRYSPLNGTKNVISLDTLTVRNFQGREGDDFRVFAIQQAPGFLVPKSVVNPQYPKYMQLTGAPEAGLTNAECWKKHKLAVGGEVAPTGAKARAGIVGLVGP